VPVRGSMESSSEEDAIDRSSPSVFGQQRKLAMATKPTYEELEQRIQELEQKIMRQGHAGGPLRETGDHYSTIVDNTREGIILQEASGKILIWNKAAEQVFGITSKEALTHTSTSRDWNTVHEDGSTFPGSDHPSLRTLSTGTPCKDVIMGVRHDAGDVCWISINTTPLFSGNESKPYAVVITFSDITERKLAEKELKESEERFKELVEHLPQGLFEADMEGILTYGNHRALQMFGYLKEDLEKGLNVLDMLIPEEHARAAAEIERVLKGSSPGKGTEYRALKKDGSAFAVDIYSSPMIRQGKIVGMRGIIVDVTERVKAETDLAEQKSFFEQMFLQSSTSTQILDKDGWCLRINPKLSQLFGVAPEDIEGHLYNIFADEGVKQGGVIPHLEKVFKEGKTAEWEVHFDIGIAAESQNIKVSEKKKVWFWNKSYPILDANGQIRYVIVQHEDITDRKRAEAKLKESEGRFRTLIEGAPEAILIQSGGRIVYLNPAMVSLVGASKPEELIGKEIMPLIAPEYREAVRERIRVQIETGKPVPLMEMEYLRLDGWRVPVEATAVPIRFQDSHAHTVFTRDITERKRAEEKVRQQEGLFRAAFESGPVGMAIIDKETRFIKVNTQICKTLGYGGDELVGRSFNAFTHPDDREGGRARWKQLLNGRQTFNLAEKRYIHKDGRIVWTIVSNALISNKEREPLYFVSHLIDISDRKQAEADRANLQDQLNQAQKMESVGRLAGGVAHDFNNKLGIIIGNVEMAMMEDDLEAPIQHQLQEIMKAAQQSAALVRQLLGFARKQTVNPRVLDLNETVSGMLKMLHRVIGEDIDLAWMPGHDLWQTKIDPTQVDQILANLAVNARDAIAGVGKMTIETDNATIDETYCAGHIGCAPGRYVLLAVTDNGVGMSKEVLEHLFEPFFTTKDVGKGTGLGLSTVYGIVKQNKGFVNVYSEPSKGTTVKIYLPRFEAGDVTVEKRAKSPTPKGGTGIVLLVEDEESILKVGKIMLEKLGYTVLAADRPSAAIRLAREHDGPIHLVLTDVVMPEMNGKELVEQLGLEYPGLKCLYMSGYTANVIAHHGILDRGVSVIQKPFSLRDLSTKVREALDKH
jgi:two-component system cell cycle sensor histidine kinase/response regulator CckA